MESKGWTGNSALHEASEIGNTEIIKTLLDRGFNVTIKDAGAIIITVY